MNDIRIVRSGISVYEVEVDLGRYAGLSTTDIKGFARRLLRAFPALRRHECYASEAGGFATELGRGTDLAHVMEHLILELLKVASGGRKRYTGWTRRTGAKHVIHFQAPDASRGRRAAECAARAIQDLVEGRRTAAQSLVSEIRASKEGRRCD